MTATEMIPAVGQTVMVACESMRVACLVQDVKMSYGRPRLRVRPLSGEGDQWIEMTRLRRSPELPGSMLRIYPSSE